MVSIKSAFRVEAWRKRFSDSTLTKKASLNAVAATLDYGARAVIGFLIQPLMVAFLGAFGYGAWQVLDRTIGYLSPATGRPTQALKVIIANRQNSTDYEEKRRYIGSAVAVWALSMPILLLLGGVLAWFIPGWLETPAEFVGGVRIAAAILLLELALISLTGLPKSVLEGENLGYKRMGLSTLLVVLGGALTLAALYFNTGIIGLATATLIVTITTGFIFLWVARKQLPWFGVAKPDFSLVWQFFGLSWWFQLWNLVMRAMRTGDVILLGFVGSAQLVTVLSFTRYAPETFVDFIVMIVFGITPGLGGMLGAGNMKAAAKVRSEIMAMTWLLSTVIGTTVLFLNKPFVGLWAGEEYYAGSLVNFLLMLMILQFAIIRNDANLIDLTLDMRNKVLIGVGSTVVSVALGALLISYFTDGIVGLCIGVMVGRLILSIEYPRLVGKSLQVPFAEQMHSAIRPTITTLLLFGGALLLEPYLLVTSWLTLVVWGGVITLPVLIIAFFIGLSSNMRAQLWRRLQFALQ